MINSSFRKHLAKEEIIRGLLTVLGGVEAKDKHDNQSNALAALMNGAVQQSDTPAKDISDGKINTC